MWRWASCSLHSFVGKIKSPQRPLYCIGYRKLFSFWVSKKLQGWLIGTDRDLFSDTWVCVCVCARVCEDHMSHLLGLSVHISLNNKLQAVFTASEGEDVGSEDKCKLSRSFYSLLSSSHTHTPTPSLCTQRPAVCDVESAWQPYK